MEKESLKESRSIPKRKIKARELRKGERASLVAQ